MGQSPLYYSGQLSYKLPLETKWYIFCILVGHSVANLSIAEKAAANGATFITHLFNAMLPVSTV